MKKNGWKIALAFLFGLGLAVGLTGCNVLEDKSVVVVIPPTCTESGYTTETYPWGYSYTYDYVEPLGHTETVLEAVAPTCVETGLTEGKYCSVCGEVLVEQRVVSCIEHIIVKQAVIAPTCTENGLTEGSYCRGCGLVLVEQQIIPFGGHNINDDGWCSGCEQFVETDGILQSEGLEIENGVIVGIGSFQGEVLYIDMPVAAHAFDENSIITTVVFGENVQELGGQAFRGCCELKTVRFLGAIPPVIGDDLFCGTWDSDEFKVYVPVMGLNSYKNAGDDCWQNSVVKAKKLYTIGEMVTYSFETNGYGEVSAMENDMGITLPTIKREGYILSWYDNAAFEGDALYGWYVSNTDVTLYAKWIAISDLRQSEGLEIENGVIVGIGSFQGNILYIDMPVAAHAFDENSIITTVVFGENVQELGGQAFRGCCELKTVRFLGAIPPVIGDDLFCGTWDSDEFKVYVPVMGLNSYKNAGDDCWQNSVVKAKKLYTIGEMVTYSFETNGYGEVSAMENDMGITLPTIKREGYILSWYDNAAFEGDALYGWYVSNTDVTLYAKWIAISDLRQSEGLEIENGVIVGIGSFQGNILYIDMPVAAHAFEYNETITAVVFGLNVSSVGEQAFYVCNSLKTVIFLSEVPLGIGSDIFGCTWDSDDFRVYVPAVGVEAYKNVGDYFWQYYLVGDEQVEAGGLEKL